MEYPIVFLSPWLVHTIVNKTLNFQAYSNNTLSKNFLKYDGPRKCNIDWTPLLRVFKFISTTPTGELTVVFNESKSKILALLTRECIRKFEAKYSQRITYCSVHSLVVVKRANLRFATVNMLKKVFGGIGGLDLTPTTEAVYLEVLELEFFHRSQFEVDGSLERRLKFVYGDPEYRKKFEAGPREKVWCIEGDGDDEMLSDEESLNSTVKQEPGK